MQVYEAINDGPCRADRYASARGVSRLVIRGRDDFPGLLREGEVYLHVIRGDGVEGGMVADAQIVADLVGRMTCERREPGAAA